MANWELAVELSQRLTVLRPEPVLQRKLFGAKELSLGGGIRGSRFSTLSISAKNDFLSSANARWVSVGAPVLVMSRWHKLPPGTVTIMTWGGLRGGISVALALSLPVGSERELVLAMTYVLVVFSILVQGLTIKQIVMWFMRSRPSSSAAPDHSPAGRG